jgi:hypothetical protein
MANSKKRCPQCRESFPTEDMIRFGCQHFCSFEHAVQYANKPSTKEKGRKIKRKELRERKEALRDKSWYLKECQRWFNKFIRMRDAGGCCISCQKPLRSDSRLKGHLYDAGHYRSVGACPELRFNEDNVHAQCVRCNRELSGNAADYRIGLVRKIGVERVEEIERDHKQKKYTIDDLKLLIAKYKVKCKELS